MNNIIQGIQGQTQLFDALLRERNDVTITTRRSQSGLLFSLFFVFFVSLWCVSFFLPLTVGAQESICAEVKLEIPQELTLERQGFEAHMRISNGLSHITLEHVHVTVTFTDEDGNQVTATSDPDAEPDLSDPQAPRFFIRLDDLEGIAAVDGSGTVASSSTADIRWLIIPVPGAGAPPSQGGNTQGRRYFVGATLTYTIGGETHVTEVTPDDILVKPMPQLFVDYFLPHEVYGDDAWTPENEPSIPFSLGVRVSNHGYGMARKLAIDSAQPRIVENKQGLLVDFLIEGSTVNDQPATPSLLVDFGTIAPETAGVARWIMTCSLSGWFTDFTAEFSHSDELGGELTSLIEEVHTHYLVHDVLLDLPNRDAIRDFLATEQPCVSGETCGPYTLYESEITETDVLDLSDSSTLTSVDGSTTTYTLALATTPPSSSEEAVWYICKPAPGAVNVPDTLELSVSAVRSDGKPIPPENVWISKARREDHGWDYFVHLFDATSAETALPSCSYTLVFGEVEAMPPVLQPIPDQSVLEGELLSFQVTASCGQDAGQDESCTPGLSATPLPVGAEFTDHGDGTGTFTWTPAIGQNGMYFLTAEASDGTLTASQPVTITVTALPTYTITATPDTNGSITPSGAVMVTQGMDQSFTITPDEGYHIIDVLIDGASVEYEGFKDEHNFVIGGMVTFLAVDADHTLEAVFTIKTYSILATAGNGGSIDPSGELTLEHGAEQIFTITPNAGYHIADVLVDGSSVGAVNAYTLSNVTAPHNIQALFASGTNTHTITATAGANGSILPTGTVTVEDGADQSFTITPNAGCHVVDVLVDGVSIGAVSAYTFTNVMEDHMIEAMFATDITTYTITATAGANGSITPSGDVTVEFGAEQSFTISADVGYYIDDVLVDGISVGAVEVYAFTNVTEDHTIEAVFSTTAPTPTPTETPIPEAVTISGRVWTSDGFTGLPDVALNGLPGSPTTDDQGYYRSDVASGWSGTVTPQKLDYSFTPVFRSYSSLMVNQEEQDYTGTAPSQTLTIVLAGEGSGVVTGDGGITCGTVCSVPVEKYTQVYLSAIPDAGSIFAGADGAECTPEGTCVLTMTEDTTVTVTFGLELEPSPTPTVGPEPTPTPTTPVIPEPATGFLVMLGLLALLGLGLGGWRKKK